MQSAGHKVICSFVNCFEHEELRKYSGRAGVDLQLGRATTPTTQQQQQQQLATQTKQHPLGDFYYIVCHFVMLL